MKHLEIVYSIIFSFILLVFSVLLSALKGSCFETFQLNERKMGIDKWQKFLDEFHVKKKKDFKIENDQKKKKHKKQQKIIFVY